MDEGSTSFDFRRLFETAPGVSIVVLPDMTVAAVTDEYLRTTLKRREELAGRNLFEAFPDNPDDSAHSTEVKESIEKVFQTGEPHELPLIKYDVQRPDGSFEERFWNLRSFPGFDEAGRIAYVVHHVQDVTERLDFQRKSLEQEKLASEMQSRAEYLESERRQAENELKDARWRLEAALEAGEIGTWTWDVVNNRVYADKSLAAMFSISQMEAEGGHLEKFVEAIHEDDREPVSQIISRALETGDFYEAEYRIRQRDGSICWVVARGKIVRNLKGQAVQLPGVVIDITGRKLSEEALRESKERFQLIARAGNDAIWDWNLQTDVVWWNDGIYTVFGYRPEQVEKTAGWWYEHIHAEDRDRVVNSIHQVIDHGGEKWSDEYRFRCADGSFKYIFDRGFAIHRDGRPIRMLGAMQDVTGRRKAEEEARQSRERLQLVLDSSRFGLWYCDLPFDVLNWSELTKKHFWLPPEAVVTIEKFYEIIHPEDREPTRSAIDQSIEDKTHYDVEYRTVNPETSEFKWIRAIGRGFYDAANQPYRFDGITIDITDEKHVQTEREHLLWSEKNARTEAENANRLKDEFLATLSHELRTPLTSILGWSRMLGGGRLDTEQTKIALETIERNAKAQSQLIEDILDVSRIISGKLRLNVVPVDLAAVIEAAFDAVRPAADAKDIRLQRILDSGVGRVSGDPDRLQQVVWNLLSNAIKFTPKGGRVQIKLERINSHVEIAVTDNGIGISTDDLPYIFERFRQSDSSTTRRHGGLGLGLAIVRHLIELHGGSIEATSGGLNQGAVFTAAFPLMAVLPNINSNTGDLRIHPAVESGNPIVCPPELKDLRILVVDDEADTREMLVSIFETCQAQIMQASTAADALKKIEANKFDILVSDIGMPEHDGYELIRKVRALPAARGGSIPAVALTAYARVEDRMRVLTAGFQMHVPKPVEPAELLTIVASLANWHGQKKDGF